VIAAWIIWLLLIIASFTVLETYSWRRSKVTLSRFVWLASKTWPPLPFVLGAICGGLCVHFWWPWCPT
jgi:hypothetical protein